MNMLKKIKANRDKLESFLPKAFETTNLRLAGLILASIENSKFEIKDSTIPAKSLIRITYPGECKEQFNKLIMEFTGRTAWVPVYEYNQALNKLHDAIRTSTKQNG